MAINRSANRRPITGSKRAEVERDILKKSGLPATAVGFSKFTREPIKHAHVELEVDEPNEDGLIQFTIRAEVLDNVNPEVAAIQNGVTVLFLLDPKTGEIDLLRWNQE